MINKTYRELGELKGLFADPRYFRQAWKSVGNAILMNPARKPITRLDKEGNETFDSLVEKYSYEDLARDLKAIQGPDREPTELEMILACQAVKARTDTSAAIFMRDTLGAKPVDESKVDQTVNAYDTLSDEELELIAELRKKHAEEANAAETAMRMQQVFCKGENVDGKGDE